MKNFKPTAMRCTESQFNEIRPELEKLGCLIVEISDFINRGYLVNNLWGDKNTVSNLTSFEVKTREREVYEQWDEKVFLQNCGFEEPEFEMVTSQEKVIEEIIPFHNFFIAKLSGVAIPIIYNKGGNSYYVSYGSLIPINPRKKELQAKEAELLKQLEEVKQELNNL